MSIRLHIIVELPPGMSRHVRLDETRAAELLDMQRAALCQMRHAGRAPKHETFGCHAFYWSGDLLDWKRRRLGVG